MTIYNLLMVIGLVVVVGIFVKGFWSSTRIKQLEQPDHWQGHSWGD